MDSCPARPRPKRKFKCGSILVTGCGGDIAIGIARILRMENISTQIIGCDIHEDHAGSAFFDKCRIVPRAAERDYIKQLLHVARSNAVDVTVLTTEPELRVFAERGLNREIEKFPVVMTNQYALCVGLDKMKTVEFLQKAYLPYPKTSIVSSGPPPQLPCIIKSRFGTGSRNVLTVNSQELVKELSVKRGEDIWQEYLYPDDQEYTCGVFRFAAGEIRTIIFKRKLQGGFTGSGVLVSHKKIDSLLRTIAAELQLQGSINIQLRLTEDGPVVFEINPRFSSTVVFRHLLGFHDVVWSLNELNGYSSDDYLSPAEGTRIYRYSKEVLLPG